MNSTYAHIITGANAVDARVRVHQGLGLGWLAASSPCEKSNFSMANTGTKRQPRRLGQRST